MNEHNIEVLFKELKGMLTLPTGYNDSFAPLSLKKTRSYDSSGDSSFYEINGNIAIQSAYEYIKYSSPILGFAVEKSRNRMNNTKLGQPWWDCILAFLKRINVDFNEVALSTPNVERPQQCWYFYVLDLTTQQVEMNRTLWLSEITKELFNEAHVFYSRVKASGKHIPYVDGIVEYKKSHFVSSDLPLAVSKTCVIYNRYHDNQFSLYYRSQGLKELESYSQQLGLGFAIADELMHRQLNMDLVDAISDGSFSIWPTKDHIYFSLMRKQPEEKPQLQDW